MKLKRILSGFLAGAVALSSMVFSSSASAETALDPWYAPVVTADGNTSNYENYGIAENFASNYQSATKIIINLTMTNGNWGWGNGSIYFNCNDGLDNTVRKFNDSRMPGMVEAGTPNASDNGDLHFTEGEATELELSLEGRDLSQWHGIALQSYGATIQFNYIEVYSGSTLLTTVRGEEFTPVDPTTDVVLNNITGTNDEKTISVATWEGATANDLVDKNWEINFYDQIAAKAEAANFTSAYNYMTRFWGIEFTFNLSAYSGDVAIPGLRAQSYAQTAAYGWIDSDDYKVSYTADDIGETLTFRLPFELLSEDTYRAVGMFVADETNFTTAGQTASISYTATATLLKEEPVTISAIDVSNTLYGTVTPKVGGVEAYEAEEGATVTLEATPDAGYELDTLTVTSASSATVGDITVSADNTFTMPAEDVTVDATFKLLEIEEIAISPVYVPALLVGNTQQLAADITPEDVLDKTVTWSSSDNTIATVSSTGLVTGVSEGEVTITATAENGVKGEATVKVTTNEVAATGITLNKSTLTLEEGASETLVATVTPEDSTDTVEWTTSDSAVATVVNGKVTAVKEGTATITATAGEFSAICTVTVEAKPEATGYDKVEANFDADTIVAQKATNADGTTNVRVVKMVKETDIANKGTVTFTLKNKAGTVKTVTSKNYYMSLVASGNKVAPKDGYVFLAITVTDIPEGEEVTCTNITLS